MSLDVTTLAMAKKYTDSQRLGFTEQNKIILGGDNEWGSHPLDRDIIGLKVTDEHCGRRFLATELDRPNASVYADSEHLYDIGGDLAFNIRYSTFEGLLSKRCLVVGNKGLHFQCPAFFHNTFTTNEGLMYVFDETTDTMGLGITLKRGWYKVNQKTFACEAVDLEKTPCFFLVDKEFNSEAAKAYLYEYSTPAKTSYTVKPENIYVNGSNSLVCNADVSGIDPNSADGVQLAMCWCSFRFSDGFVSAAIPYPEFKNINVVIEYETIHTIDPKFLPSGGGGSVVSYTLKTVIKGGTAAQLLCEEDCAFLDKQAEKREGFLCNFTEDYSHDDDPNLICDSSFFLNYGRMPDGENIIRMFIAYMGNQTFRLVSMGEGWAAAHGGLE